MSAQPSQWGATASGKLFTRTVDWSLRLSSDGYHLIVGGTVLQGSVADLERLRVSPGVFWATLNLYLPGREPISLDGIPNAEARVLAAVVTQAVRKVRVAALLRNFDQALRPVLKWASGARGACKAQLAARGWLTREFKEIQSSLKPGEVAELLTEPEVVRHLEAQGPELKDAVALWRRSFNEVADGINEGHLGRELQEFKAFFEQVEKSPLTDEQAKAVVCFDNRVLLVASAGSGKTSTMVAKAGYALKKRYFEPAQILLLAFN
jgi:DNA helicase-4